MPTFAFSFGKRLPDVKDPGGLISFIVVFVATSVSFLFKLLQYYIDGNTIPKWLNRFLLWIIESHHIDLSSATLEDNELKFQLQSVSIQLSKFTTIILLLLVISRVIIGKIRKIRYGTITDITNIMTIYLIHQTRQENIPIFGIDVCQICFIKINLSQDQSN